MSMLSGRTDTPLRPPHPSDGNVVPEPVVQLPSKPKIALDGLRGCRYSLPTLKQTQKQTRRERETNGALTTEYC